MGDALHIVKVNRIVEPERYSGPEADDPNLGSEDRTACQERRSVGYYVTWPTRFPRTTKPPSQAPTTQPSSTRAFLMAGFRTLI